MKVNAITMRAGHVIEYNNKLCVVLKHEIMQPGKGAAVIQIDMRDLKTGNKDSVRFRTQEVLERVQLEQTDHTYLYPEGDIHHFMNSETFEQVGIPADIIGDAASFLQEGMVVVVESYEEQPLGVTLPATVVVTVEDCEPVVKGQTASSSYKPAKVDGGVRVMVPPHIEAGTRIVVKTEDGSYVEKSKD
jgi:elongation factor P